MRQAADASIDSLECCRNTCGLSDVAQDQFPHTEIGMHLECYRYRQRDLSIYASIVHVREIDLAMTW